MISHIKRYYEELYRRHGEALESNGYQSERTYNMRRRLVREMLTGVEAGRVADAFDAGCGNGLFFEETLRPLLPALIRVDGRDMVEEGASLARAYLDEVTVGDVVEMEDIESRYDLVNSTEVFLLVDPERYGRFFASHLQLLKPGGYFLLTVPNLDSVYRKVFRPEPELFPYHFSADTVLGLYPRDQVELIDFRGIDLFYRTYSSPGWLARFVSFEFSFLFQKTG